MAKAEKIIDQAMKKAKEVKRGEELRKSRDQHILNKAKGVGIDNIKSLDKTLAEERKSAKNSPLRDAAKKTAKKAVQKGSTPKSGSIVQRGSTPKVTPVPELTGNGTKKKTRKA